MKKLFILSLAACLVLSMGAVTMAANHNFTGDFVNPFQLADFSTYSQSFDGWYYIEKDDPSATVRLYSDDDVFALGGEYFLNDQTFVNFAYDDQDNFDSVSYLKGSYLFKNGLFAGLDFADNSDDTQANLSAGYRLNLSKDAYIAFSLDYAMNDYAYADTGIIDYEIYGRYYTNNARFYGQLLIPNEDVVYTDEAYFMVGGAVKVADNVVVGANIIKFDDFDYFDLGATVNVDKWELELQYADLDNVGSAVSANALYSFTKALRAGIQITDVEDVDDLDLDLKLAYDIDAINSLKLVYQLENDSYDSLIYLRWDIKIK